MPTDTTFRLSTYLTFALSCVCIWYAEWEMLPEIGLVAGGAIIALVVLFRLESRVELLSIPAAQRLAVVLGLISIVWGTGRLLWERQHNRLQNVTWVLMGVMMFGLVLITLMPAKLARREKHVGDYWVLHGIALVIVILAGAIAEDPICFILISLYAGSAVWSLSLFHLRQAGGSILPAPGERKITPIAGVLANRNQLGLHRAMAFIFATSAFALPLYFITPRSTQPKFTFGQQRMEIGFSADPVMDLNKTGNLQANDTVAFEVEAEVDGQPTTNLSPDQRWRGRILRHYSKGVWTQDMSDLKLPGIPDSHFSTRPWSQPDLGPAQYKFTFSVPPQQPIDFFADPVVWDKSQGVPIALSSGNGYAKGVWGIDGPFFLRTSSTRENESDKKQYVQFWKPEKDADLSPPFHFQASNYMGTLQSLRIHPTKVKEYAQLLLNEIIQSGKIPSNYWDNVNLLPRPEFHNVIAREFCRHLASSPDFRYTTNLKREMKNLDPIEEFLFHTRSGHCERFASALALLLRSEGIPTVLVLGYKGCEPTNVPGKYLIREERAHAWVQALIQESHPNESQDQPPVSRWLSLDPTPNGSQGSESASGSELLQPAISWVQKIYRRYILEYTPERRKQAIQEFIGQATRTETLAVICSLVLGALFLKSLLLYRRKHREAVKSTTDEGLPESNGKLPIWYLRLTALLKVLGYSQMPGESPLEFATRVAKRLENDSITAPMAVVPLDCVEAYYETRFGGKDLASDHLARLETGLSELSRLSGQKP